MNHIAKQELQGNPASEKKVKTASQAELFITQNMAGRSFHSRAVLGKGQD